MLLQRPGTNSNIIWLVDGLMTLLGAAPGLKTAFQSAGSLFVRTEN
jgi:hypothetical protein